MTKEEKAAYDKEYRKREDIVARDREYRRKSYLKNRDKILAKKKTDERLKEYKREYNSRPEVIEKRRLDQRAQYHADSVGFKSRIRKHALKAKYGLTLEAYEKLLVAQNGRCAICGNSGGRKDGSGRLHVDHNHRTGKVRGLLCGWCNTSIGRFDDRPDILPQTIEYLKRDLDNGNSEYHQEDGNWAG